MRVKKYLALTLAAILATTMLTACPWDQEEDETDDASSVPVTSTDTSQDDDSSDSNDEKEPAKPALSINNGQTIAVGQTSEEIDVENGAYTVALTRSGGTDGTLTMTIETRPAEKYVTNSVNATVGNASASWTRDTATRARTLSVRTDTQLSLTTNDEGKTFTLTGIPADATSCSISVTFTDLGYVIENGTYKVHSAEGLKAFADEVNGGKTGLNCTLTSNIALTGEWTPIGSSSTPYTGTFDGGGHAISGLQVSGGDYVGLFGYVNGGTVQNVNLTNVRVSGSDWVGSVAGYNYNGTIQGCMVSGSVSGSDWVGGIVGRNAGTVKGCCFAGSSSSVTAHTSIAWVGGVVGCNYGTVEGCCFAGDSVTASGTGAAAGGVVGYNGSGSITDCYWKKDTNGPDLGVGQNDGIGTLDVKQIKDDVTMQDAIDAMNKYLTDYQYKWESSQIVLVANSSNTTELPGLTQKVLDAARAIGL